jgi:hypothetical protein
MQPKRAGKSGRYFIVLNCDSEYGLSSDTCGRLWLLVMSRSTSTTAAAVTRAVTGVSGNDYTMTETESGQSASTNYRRTAQGQLALDFAGDSFPASVRALVGDVLEYAEPFYPVGGTRRVIRQGSAGEDLDGDGHRGRLVGAAHRLGAFGSGGDRLRRLHAVDSASADACYGGDQ